MASAQQLIGLIKSHAEGDEDRFFDLAMQLAAAEAQKGHTRLAEQLRQWAEASKAPPNRAGLSKPTPLAAPRGDLAGLLSASYPTTRLSDVILPSHLGDELAHVVVETRMTEQLESKGLRPRRRLLLAGPPGTGKTLTAAALAGELKYPLFTALLHGLITKFMGETAQKLRMVFDAVRTTRGVYLFDEIDALAAARGAENDVGEARRVLNSFLQFLDEDAGPSIVVATTNLPQILDRAILRRFDLVLPYEMPAGYFRNSSLLFLGCSLNQDRTVRVFEAIKAKARADLADLPQHFSIEQCPGDELALIARNEYLLRLGITPIWFPAGQFDFVEGILRLARNELLFRRS